MADRIIESKPGEVPDIPEVLQSVLAFILDEGKEKIEKGEDLNPFTALAVKDKLFEESASASTVDACYAMAKHTVAGARGADAYGFCYDGYIDLDERQVDAVIAEGGVPNTEHGYAVGYVYERGTDGKAKFEKQPTYIGLAPNFMGGLKESSEYSDDEIDDKYLTEDAEEETEASDEGEKGEE